MSRFKAFSVIIHIAGWLLFMAFPLAFLNSRGQNSSIWALLQKPDYWLFCFSYAILFYCNAYFFIPKFFLTKEYFFYSLLVLLLLIGFYFLRPFDRLLHATDSHTNVQMPMNDPPTFAHPTGDDRGFGGPPPQGQNGQMPPQGNPPANGQGFHQPPPPFSPDSTAQGPGGLGQRFGHLQPLDSTSLFIFLMIMALSTAIRTVQQWQLTEQRAARAEADKSSAELSFLKAQINPHFLFNTLNNIYTLAVTKDDNAADSIMKLSNIMRYVTDDVTEDFVPLESETDCISDYIELQRLRIGNNTTVNFKVEGNTADKKIAPLVLMTFIENVFKYGVSKHENSIIDVKIAATDASLLFYCKNRIFGVSSSDYQRTGIGIKNTKQRLEHLYSERHLLNISNQNGEYTVQLTLQT